MSNNLKEEMQAFSDQRILNNIKQQNSFSPASVEAAKEIASERGLLTEEQISNIDKQADQEVATGQTKLHESEGTSTLTIGTVLLIIFIVVRIIMRLSNA